MAGEVVTLYPNNGSSVSITGDLELDMAPDWGDHVVQATLATGPDVIGGIVGVRTRTVRTVTLPIRIRSTDATDYLTAAQSIATAAAQLGLEGGTLTRQVDFGGGYESEELELTVLECDLKPEDGWLQAHRFSSVVTLELTCDPAWLAVEELVGEADASTDTEIVFSLSRGRGNLPGPGRVFIEDAAAEARYFVELGMAFEELVTGAAVEFRAADFDVTDAEGVLGADANAIGGQKLQVDGLFPVWRPVGYLLDLTHKGSHRVRIRARGGTEDANVLFRAVWRPGKGVWQELDAVTVPEDGSYYDLDAGTIRHYGEDQNIDVRIDTKGSDVDATGNAYLNAITLTPAEVYAVARGVPVQQADSSLAIYDDFPGLSGGIDGSVAEIAPATFDTWTKEESGGTGSPDWKFRGVGGIMRSIGSGEDDTAITGGQFQVLGDPTMTDCLVSLEAVLCNMADTHTGSESRVGMALRFVDVDNCLMVTLRNRKVHNGRIHRVTAVKMLSGSPTKLTEFDVEGTFLNGMFASVDGDGVLVFGTEAKRRTLGADADLATDGDLEAGRVGVYGASNHSAGFVSIGTFTAMAAVPSFSLTGVVRKNGRGEFTSEGAWATGADGGNPSRIAYYQGSRVWIPPLAGKFAAKVRTSDSESAPDEGAGLETDVLVYRRPAFASLSDAMA